MFSNNIKLLYTLEPVQSEEKDDGNTGNLHMFTAGNFMRRNSRGKSFLGKSAIFPIFF